MLRRPRPRPATPRLTFLCRCNCFCDAIILQLDHTSEDVGPIQGHRAARKKPNEPAPFEPLRPPVEHIPTRTNMASPSKVTAGNICKAKAKVHKDE